MAEDLKKKNEEQLNEEQLDEVNGGAPGPFRPSEQTIIPGTIV